LPRSEGDPPEKGSLREKLASAGTMIPCAYILKSLKDGHFYYGSTGNLLQRLSAHNAGKVRSTKGRRPFVLHYFEEFKTIRDARKRENFFKSIAGYQWLRNERIIERPRVVPGSADIANKN
jgi:putative endonuclease